jgi:hypothetical protein
MRGNVSAAINYDLAHSWAVFDKADVTSNEGQVTMRFDGGGTGTSMGPGMLLKSIKTSMDAAWWIQLPEGEVRFGLGDRTYKVGRAADACGF